LSNHPVVPLMTGTLFLKQLVILSKAASAWGAVFT